MYLVDNSHWQRVVELTRAIEQLSEKWNEVIERYRWKIGVETPMKVPVELHLEEYLDCVDNQLRLVLEGDADYIFARDRIDKWKQERREIAERIIGYENH